MSAAWAILAEARAAGVNIRLVDGKPRVKGEPPPQLLARLRAAKGELASLLAGEMCRHCGAALDWLQPGALAFADGTGAHLPCHERAEVERLHRAAERVVAGVMATSDDGELLVEEVQS